ncbi:unnamed protein product [Didymodactylos carnosus]|uniref:Uncharacterized protein n=1 Tax=Didymodactylos carnosus TaxID=1234261 RepID=A0A8S2CZ74_9BILA|nr:unnamed protein product [Didymodactylos carnosus]CAF3584044.1 unnamed protein product [Didymodactylos carnosus]
MQNKRLGIIYAVNKPAIDVVYKTILDEELQTIQLKNSQTAIVSQTLYDDLGRQAIIVKPTQIIVNDAKPLLAFQNDFIQNGYIHQNTNVWQTGKLIKQAINLIQRMKPHFFLKPQEQEFIQGDKITYRLMYEKSNGKFRVVFEPQQVAKELEIEKTKHRRLYELNNQEIKVTLQEMARNLQNDSHSLAEHFKEILLVDLTKYLPQLNINQITWSNKKWLFDGYQWQEKIIEEDIVQGNKFIYKLEKDYILYKANKEASFKLYKQDAKGQRQ